MNELKKYSAGIYNPSESCIFKKNNEAFGGLSNMSTEYPLLVNSCLVRTNEALYQAMKFPYHPEVQKEILEQKSPMAVKIVTRKNDRIVRGDLESVKVDIMRWCLRVKLAQHFSKFGSLLESTGLKFIVENSSRDSFWGAKLNKEGNFEGRNVLGRLLKELREIYMSEKRESLLLVAPPPISNLILCGQPIEIIDGRPNN